LVGHGEHWIVLNYQGADHRGAGPARAA
jgi:hypothetical protein